MNTKNPFRFSMALLMVTLFCTACRANQVEQTDNTNPLLSALAGIPQYSFDLEDDNDFIFYFDSLAMESAYSATRPKDAEEFVNFQNYAESYTVWRVVRLESVLPLILGNRILIDLETMPTMVGFSTFDIDQAIRFGTIASNGLILKGNFNTDAIQSAYQANFDFVAKNVDGTTIWCPVEGCLNGMEQDLNYRKSENLFGGIVGQRQPMYISDNILMASSDLDLVLAHIDTTRQAAITSLADDSGYRAVVNAVNLKAHILQATIINPTIAQRIATKPPIDERLSPAIRSVALEALSKDFRELPPYELLILADAVTENEQIARIGIVFQDVKSAESAAPILLNRLAVHQPIQTQTYSPFSEILTIRNVTNPRFYTHQEADKTVLVLEFPTRKATSDEIVLMLDRLYQGTATRPGSIYKAFLQLFMSNDTSWLSTYTQAEIEELLVEK